ncbi:AraC family transcriptional regulator [Pedobacter gandavensis]|uniref:AraC family transcriptional regulator n=1 Tax=Pedobacter gandavensis TaxID=2679963 RepID=A0ABR6EQR8_9SPHI|nr:AraC family transcriptional regulator [Pedobacter gandavensis]MBB2147579.1 AraC family transcriptional regulator [Pedobacter gandavensis]
MKLVKKKRHGFNGEKLISLPKSLYERKNENEIALNLLYITHIGYFPKAEGHYRSRLKGCTDHILMYCTAGKGWFSIGTEKHNVMANQFFILPATDLHSQYASDPSDPWTIYWVHFIGDNLTYLNQTLSVGDLLIPRTIPYDDHKIKLWNMMYNCFEKGYSEENLIYANLTFYYFIANFLFPKKTNELTTITDLEFPDKIINYMQANLAQKLTIKDMADEFSYSVSHFQNLFRKRTGISPIDYFIQLKIQKACQLLALSDLRIKSVAASIGYPDPYYFSRIFNKVMGMSPLVYRRINKIGNYSGSQ